MNDQSRSMIAIRKPAGATHMRNVYSSAERKLLNGCWHTAESYGFRNIELNMSLHDLCNYLGIAELKNTEWMREVIKALVTKPVEWNSLGKDRTREWGVCTFLQHGKIRGGTFYFKLTDKFMGWAKDPAVYTRLRLAFTVQVTSKHAIALYEFLTAEMDTSGRPTAAEFIFDVPLRDVRKLLNLGSKQYSRYSNLRQHVLLPATQEISKHGDITVTFDKIVKDRKAVGISFNVVRKEQHQLPLELVDLNIQEAADLDTSLLQAPSEEMEELVSLLASCDIGERKALNLIQMHGPKRVRRNIAYSLEARMEKKVKKISGYLVKAAEEDYGDGWSGPKINETINRWKQQEKKQLMGIEAKKRQAEITALKKDFAELKEGRLAAYLEEKTADWVEKEKKLFETAEQPSLIAKALRDEGWSSPLVQATFRAHLSEKLLQKPEEQNFNNFVKWRDKQPVR